MAAITGSGRFPAPSNTGPWPSPSLPGKPARHHGPRIETLSHGLHSSPELSRCSLRRRDFDEPLLQELLRRWTARYLSAQPEWSDVALFHSLNMVNQACLIPAGADAVLHDFGIFGRLHYGVPLLKFSFIQVLARISQTHLGGVSSGADEPGCGSICVVLRQSGPGLIV